MLTWHSLLAVLHFCHQIAGSNARCFWKWRCMDLRADTNMKANQERLLVFARQASSVLWWHQSVLGATFSGMGGHEAPHVWISLEPGLKHTWHMMLCNMKSMQVNFGCTTGSTACISATGNAGSCTHGGLPVVLLGWPNAWWCCCTTRRICPIALPGMPGRIWPTCFFSCVEWIVWRPGWWLVAAVAAACWLCLLLLVL